MGSWYQYARNLRSRRICLVAFYVFLLLFSASRLLLHLLRTEAKGRFDNENPSSRPPTVHFTDGSSVPSPSQTNMEAEEVKKAKFVFPTKAWLKDLGEEWEDEECIPTHPWQLPKHGHLSCNLLHELDMSDAGSDFRHINCGGKRCVFGIDDTTGNRVVLKISKYDKAHMILVVPVFLI